MSKIRTFRTEQAAKNYAAKQHRRCYKAIAVCFSNENGWYVATSPFAEQIYADVVEIWPRRKLNDFRGLSPSRRAIGGVLTWLRDAGRKLYEKVV